MAQKTTIPCLCATETENAPRRIIFGRSSIRSSLFGLQKLKNFA
jgi:hypothetical protein